MFAACKNKADAQSGKYILKKFLRLILNLVGLNKFVQNDLCTPNIKISICKKEATKTERAINVIFCRGRRGL